MSVNEEQFAIRTHLPCENPECVSSDGMSEYADHKYCFSCETRMNKDGEDTTSISRTNSASFNNNYPVIYSALVKRYLTEENCKFWSYGIADVNGQKIHCVQYKDHTRSLVAQKLRFPDKTFPWTNRKAFKDLYGQWLWRDGGRKVVITEGELDALSVSQCQGNKWPVVSLPDGGGKNAVRPIQEALSWLQSFDQIILFFDNDEKGNQTVDLVKNLLPIGKVYIAMTPEGYKDANDMLVAGKSSELIDCIWSAKKWTPTGIITGADVIDRLVNRPDVVAYPYPDYMGQLNYKTGGGIRLGELDTWTSGTGMGKTTIIKALQNHFFHTSPFNQALAHFEEPLEDTGDDLIAYEVGKRFQLYDAFGSVEDDERKRIDRMMHKLKSLTVELNIYIGFISHLRKPSGNGKSFEEGAVPSLDDLRGSGGIKQLSNGVFAISRDQQAINDAARNTSAVTVLKCRKMGWTGHADYLTFSDDTGQLRAGVDPNLSEFEDETEDNGY